MSGIFGLLSLGQMEEKPKFTKDQAAYREAAPVYRCGRCRFYLGDEMKCQIVDETGEPGSGVINQDGGCYVWNAGPIRQMSRERRFGRGPTG